MKLALLFFGLILFFSCGRDIEHRMELKERTISLVGKGEVEVIPDRITIQFTLGTYQKGEAPKYNNNDYYDLMRQYESDSNQMSIKNIKKELEAKLMSLGLFNVNLKKSEESSMLDNLYSSYSKKKSYGSSYGVAETKEEKYDLIVTSKDKAEMVMDNLDIKGVYAFVTKKEVENEEQYYIKARLKALKNAKDQAQELAESIDRELGDVITIKEKEIYEFGSRKKGLSEPNPNIMTVKAEISVEFELE